MPAGSMRKTNESPSAVAEIACACAAVRRAARAVTQLYDGWLRAHGIEGPQFALLAMLDRGACNQATLGRRFDLDKTTVSRNLKLLKRNGWIELRPGLDPRERLVALTPGGRRRLAAARPAWRNAQRQLRSSVTAKEWDAIRAAFHSVTLAAQNARRVNAQKGDLHTRPRSSRG
jgi:DNA-binding MarR family transcriptional regulator